MNITELIAECERLDAEATSGPWKDDHVGNVRAILGVAHQVIIPRTFNDSEFIARSRTLLPLLVAVITNQQRQIEKLWGFAVANNSPIPDPDNQRAVIISEMTEELHAIAAELEDVKP